MKEDTRDERERQRLLKHKPEGWEDLRKLSKGITEDTPEESALEKLERIVRQEVEKYFEEVSPCSCEKNITEPLYENAQRPLVKNGQIMIGRLLELCSEINASAKGKYGEK